MRLLETQRLEAVEVLEAAGFNTNEIRFVYSGEAPVFRLQSDPEEAFFYIGDHYQVSRSPGVHLLHDSGQFSQWQGVVGYLCE